MCRVIIRLQWPAIIDSGGLLKTCQNTHPSHAGQHASQRESSIIPTVNKKYIRMYVCMLEILVEINVKY